MKSSGLSSFFPVCLCVLAFTCMGFGSCDKKWPEACNDPFDRIMPAGLEGSVEVQDGVIILRFPYHVVGSMNGYRDGRYGLPEAVDGEVLEPGTSFPMNTLCLPADTATAPKVIELGAGSGVSLEGFSWADHFHLETNWDFPDEWKGTYQEELCNRSCFFNHEKDLDCGINWSLRYTFGEQQLQGTVQVTSLGTLPGESIDIEILGVATGIDVNEDNLDCCTGLHIKMKGTVGSDRRIVFDDYCDDPSRYCDGCTCEDPMFFDEGNVPMFFRCAAGFSSVEEQLAACWDLANGIEPY
jgi:hypothetical protein